MTLHAPDPLVGTSSDACLLRRVTIPAFDALPELTHGFEQRTGPTGWESRDATRRRVGAALQSIGRLLLLQQVHGVAVHRAPWTGRPVGDAAICDVRGFVLGVETADCLPVLFADPDRRTVAVAHAGWRGTAAGIARVVVEALAASGSPASGLLAAIGPGIGPCCYQVGPEVKAAFGPGSENVFRSGVQGQLHLDLRAANHHQLLEVGLRPENIHHLADCTFCRPDLYHSYRREGRGGGRMISFIGLR